MRIAALTTTAGSNERTSSEGYSALAAVRAGDVITTEVTNKNVARHWMLVGLVERVRSLPNPATRHFKTQMAHLRYPRLRGMLEPKVKLVDSHWYAYIIGNSRDYAKAYPMVQKNESIDALDDFVKKAGIPEMFFCDNDATMEGWNEWMKRVPKYSIDPKYTEPYSPFQNKAELNIRKLKRMIRQF